jgi:toxin YoeB
VHVPGGGGYRACVLCGARSGLTKQRAERDAVFQPEFREDLRRWVETDRRVALRVLDLVEAIIRDPFRGIGKPEPLRHLAPNTWSRRVTQEHRVVYLVRPDRIDFLQARYHY